MIYNNLVEKKGEIVKKETEKKFIEEFPEYFKEMYGDPSITCMAFGITCGDGWFDLLWKLCEGIKKLNPKEFKFAQIKEKFAILRCYVDMEEEDDDKVKQIYNLINESETKSGKICECCGNPGSKRTFGYWMMTRCDKCYQEQTSKKS